MEALALEGMDFRPEVGRGADLVEDASYESGALRTASVEAVEGALVPQAAVDLGDVGARVRDAFRGTVNQHRTFA